VLPITMVAPAMRFDPAVGGMVMHMPMAGNGTRSCFEHERLR
jgi:hypothetical protein